MDDWAGKYSTVSTQQVPPAAAAAAGRDDGRRRGAMTVAGAVRCIDRDSVPVSRWTQRHGVGMYRRHSLIHSLSSVTVYRLLRLQPESPSTGFWLSGYWPALRPPVTSALTADQ